MSALLTTERLVLVPGSVALARAEISDRAEFARLLDADVPEAWPPETLADALPFFLSLIEASPHEAEWFGWYVMTHESPSATRVLVASGGFKGAPIDGLAEIGYSVLPEFQGRGYATESVRSLARWALAQPGVTRVLAETEWANPASVRVLERAGFLRAGDGELPGSARYLLHHGG